MGDGNTLLVFDNNEKTAGSKSSHLDDETPRSIIDEDISTPAESTSPTRLTPLEVEELHRNTNSSVNTPGTISDQSSASLHSPRKQSITDETTSNPETPRRGRRNYREASDNEFGLPLGPAAGLGPQEVSAPDGNQAIFSVRGTRSFKINRHRDSVTVFPSGCMGVKDSDDIDETPEAMFPVVEETATVVPQATAPPVSPSIVLARPASAARNPLTGEGYEAKDYERQTGVRKRATDGNPVLGQGYSAETRRPTKVPPGGYSQGLW